VTRQRLDGELVRRGFVATPDEAAEAIEAGRVTVAGRPAVKPETLVSASEPVAITSGEAGYASRGGHKLAAALDHFGVDPAGRVCLDAGASSGGFTDVLLQRGASRVIAVDVGYGQLAWNLRTDERVTVMERTNVRDLRPEDLSARPGLVTADLSFISLATVIPTLVELANDGADLILLVKPQFEAARGEVGRGGVVSDPDVWRRVLASVSAASRSAGAPVVGFTTSPLRGPAGNVEFFLHACLGAAESDLDMEEAIREGQALREVKGAAS
jgi:23S rRNA (cytidine1920-2'-O)/16S rRNA (cytidine1409-2'-O)-methyltransferase